MRRQTTVAATLYSQIFPRPTTTDPPNFSAHLARNLIPEIRVETARFYGGLSSIEARYPGLNYTYGPHRMRLSHFPHHDRLFAAMDALQLTDGEILDLARWEGTVWARERFERDEDIKVQDTTGDSISEWSDPRSFIDDQEFDYESELEDETPTVELSRKFELDIDEASETNSVHAQTEEQEDACQPLFDTPRAPVPAPARTALPTRQAHHEHSAQRHNDRITDMLSEVAAHDIFIDERTERLLRWHAEHGLLQSLPDAADLIPHIADLFAAETQPRRRISATPAVAERRMSAVISQPAG